MEEIILEQDSYCYWCGDLLEKGLTALIASQGDILCHECWNESASTNCFAFYEEEDFSY